MVVAIVAQIWRYPVKSMGGEPMADARIARHGLVGDRHWTVYDPLASVVRSAKQWPELLALSARYEIGCNPRAEDHDDAVQPVILVDADGASCSSRERVECNSWLEQRLGRPARLRSRRSPADRDFYRLPRPRTAAGIATELALGPDEPIPALESGDRDLAAALTVYATPPGFLYDAYPLHVMTTDSLDRLQRLTGLEADVRRFRPNLLMKTTQPGDRFTEQHWVGRTLAIGEVLIRIHSETLRCSMPGHAQPGFRLTAEPGLPVGIARSAGRKLGVNAEVLRPGLVRLGDPVRFHAP